MRLGEEAIADSVNAIVLAPEYPADPAILTMLGAALLVSRDGGRSWSAPYAGAAIDQELVAVLAPQGLDPGAPLLVGLLEGGGTFPGAGW